MTFFYKDVYLNETARIAGPYEKNGPMANTFDKTYSDFYFGRDTWEQAEVKLIEESTEIVLKKMKKTKQDLDVHISGDLLNQLVASNYAARTLAIPYFGIYSACATSVEGLILAANMIEAKQVKTALCTTSSHNNAAEKQFRYPVEYGGPKRKTTTFTVTGGTAAYVSREKKGFKILHATLGRVIDLGVKDVYHMGAVMAPAAADTLYRHLQNTKTKISDYDLIMTGDLGKYGKQILIEYMASEYGITLTNYEDAACLIYRDVKEAYAGGSGPACLPLVAYGLLSKKQSYKKVLLIATGALMNSSMTNQKLSIPAIAHAISLEVLS